MRILQRGGRKTLTTLEGLPRGVDPQKMLKLLKKQFDCNGTIVETAEGEQVVQLQGDHREKLGEFLIEGGFAKKGEVKVHGT
ncbi:SUI1 family translation initiation factor [Streptomyces sp. NPDC046261]|uniref:SUI1 family translation initiation factor n=1 Tax=Streptomyces sp. NPDC046261 TaxID=3157200 RepID=UPI0033C85522